MEDTLLEIPEATPLNTRIAGLSEAVKKSGSYDVWVPEPSQPALEDGLETIQKPVPKVRVLFHFFGLH